MKMNNIKILLILKVILCLVLNINSIQYKAQSSVELMTESELKLAYKNLLQEKENLSKALTEEQSKNKNLKIQLVSCVGNNITNENNNKNLRINDISAETKRNIILENNSYNEQMKDMFSSFLQMDMKMNSKMASKLRTDPLYKSIVNFPLPREISFLAASGKEGNKMYDHIKICPAGCITS